MVSFIGRFILVRLVVRISVFYDISLLSFGTQLFYLAYQIHLILLILVSIVRLVLRSSIDN